MMDLEQESPATAHWSRPQYEELFRVSKGQSSERVAWVGDDESAPHEVLAFLVAHKVDAEWELENIVVAEAARRQGIGTRLLRELIAHARAEHGNQILLEVRESNQSARALYRRAGFQETGLRKSYYSDPPEDAILYHLSLY
jgi:ribosomal-protein-alanine N-acetyltransferase